MTDTELLDWLQSKGDVTGFNWTCYKESWSKCLGLCQLDFERPGETSKDIRQAIIQSMENGRCDGEGVSGT